MGEKKILTGWKEIESFIGLKRKAILRLGYPVRRAENGASVMAMTSEILEYFATMPKIVHKRPQIDTKGHKKP